MELNTDDTQLEQYSNYMASKLPDNVMVNCEKCSRLFFILRRIGIQLHNQHKLFCIRCR